MAAGNSIGKMLGIVFLIVAATAVAPEIFTNTAALETDTNTPAWVSSLVVLLAGFAIVFVIYKGTGMDKQ